MLAGLFLLAQTWQPATGDVALAYGNWGRIAGWSGDGRVWAAWHGGGDIFARAFDRATLAPLGVELAINVNVVGQQDEPEIARDLVDGNVFVAWSDRSGAHTSYMAAVGAVLAPDGSVIRPEFPLHSWHQPSASKWRPLVQSLPDGGFVACWTSGWGEDAVVRSFASDGTELGPELLMHAPSGSSQSWPAACATRGGALAGVWLEDAVPTPKDLFGAILGGPTKHWVTPVGRVGRQLEPRIASDARGLVATVWHSDAAATSGYDVWMRRSSYRGIHLGPEALIASGSGNQLNPKVALADAGGGIVVWSDDGAQAIEALDLDALGVPSGAEWQMNLAPLGAQLPNEAGRRTPAVWLAPDGAELVVVWSGSGSVVGRRFTR